MHLIPKREQNNKRNMHAICDGKAKTIKKKMPQPRLASNRTSIATVSEPVNRKKIIEMKMNAILSTSQACTK